MARSRVGGSSGLLSGKVGDVIFNITRNADGSFRQVITPNPDGRFNPNTDEQARARMTMAMIERAMFTYRDFMGTGFEGVDPGTNSISKFSEVNYNEVKQEILDYWNEPDWTEWNYDFPRKGQSIPLDGMFIISQGSIKWEGYIFCQPATPTQRFFEVECRGLGNSPTVRQWLARYNLKPGMQFVGIFFCMGTTPSRSFVAWIMLYTEPSARLDDVLTASNWRNYIKTNSNVPLNSYFSNTDGSLHLRCERLDDLQISRTGCTGRRIRMRDENVFRYNNCQMQWVTFPSPQEAWGWKTLWDVKNSWISNPVPPTPTHRIPLEYQEVLYITAVKDVVMLYNKTLNMSKMSMEFKVSAAATNWANIIYTSNDVGRFCFISNVSHNQFGYMIRSRDNNGNVDTNIAKSFVLDRTYHFFISTDSNGYVITLDGNTERYPNTGAIINNDFSNFNIFGVPGYCLKGSIYEIIIRDKNTNNILHDLVPCYRKSDGAIGFYDINDSYFLSVNNSQTKMAYGPIVNPT